MKISRHLTFRMITLTTLAVVCLFAQAKVTFAQWATNGNNISNTNSGNVGIGTTAPSNLLHVNSGSSPSSQLRLSANNTGSLSGLAYSPDNIALGFDVDWNNGWIARHSAIASLYKVGSKLQMLGSTGNTVGSASSWTPYTTLDLATGNFGVGTDTPSVRMDLKGNNVAYGGQLRLQATDYSQITFYNSNNSALNAANRLGSIYYDIAGTRLNLDNHSGTKHILLNWESGGNVGIGLHNPAHKLDVNGTVNATNIVAKYQDLAEWVPAAHALPPGTVVTLNETQANLVEASSKAYDTRVAGVISARPGIALGERGENKVLVATTGRVRIKVDATKAPIRIGDLLVTSAKEGVAMKSEAINFNGVEIHRPGTIIGKALESLAQGTGEILVLLSLQ